MLSGRLRGGARWPARPRWPVTWPRLSRTQVGWLAVVLFVAVSDRVSVVVGDQGVVLDLVANLHTRRWWLVQAPVGVLALAGWIWWGHRRATRVPCDVGQLAARWQHPAPRPRDGGQR